MNQEATRPSQARPTTRCSGHHTTLSPSGIYLIMLQPFSFNSLKLCINVADSLYFWRQLSSPRHPHHRLLRPPHDPLVCPLHHPLIRPLLRTPHHPHHPLALKYIFNLVTSFSHLIT